MSADAGGVKVWRTPDGAWFGGRPLSMPGEAHLAFPAAQAAAMERVVGAAVVLRAEWAMGREPGRMAALVDLVRAVDALAHGGEGGGA